MPRRRAPLCRTHRRRRARSGRQLWRRRPTLAFNTAPFCFCRAATSSRPQSVYYRLLQLLAGGGPEAAAFASVRRCAAGQAFDSPVDFTSEAVSSK